MNNSKIMVNGKEYETENLSDEQNYLVRQVSDLAQQSVDCRFKLDQITVAREVFLTKLTRMLEDPQ
jgi:hypothetical protein